MLIFLISLTSFYFYISWALFFSQKFRANQHQIQWRVHVNGIRGKSSVTRYVAAVFRTAGYHTFGKTTGTAARVIRPNGQDYDFGRKGYANVNEQVKILTDFSRQKAQAVVMECMAVNPVYAKWLEEKVMFSQIGIITNVRLDHTDYMGETLEEIAESLSNTIPRDGILITSETNPKLLKILDKNARKKNSALILAQKKLVSNQDLEGFNHFVIEENVAIGYCIASLLKIPKEKALLAMQNAPAEPGAFTLQYLHFSKYKIAWANLFAVNDRESFIELSLKLFKQCPDYSKVVILNNRADRPTRVEIFALESLNLGFERVITFGDYELQVNQVFVSNPHLVVNLGNSTNFKHSQAPEILSQIVAGINSEKILLIGTVNIHTNQAEKLLHFFQEQLHLPQVA
jgi:gamma-polyglutamate synthase